MSTLSVSGGVAHAGDFDNLDVPQIIPNAYKKATEKVDSGKKAGEVAKKLNEDAGNAIQGGAQEAENNINDKMKEIMQAAGWTGPTLMVGQISGSIFDIFNATNSTVNLSKDEQEAWKSRGYDMTSYQAFGEALTNLRSQSWDRSPTELGGGAVVDGVTQAATAFIQPLTLQVLSQNSVHLDVMKEPYPNKVNHIELGKETDLFIVVPATANTIAKLAHGLADNMVTTTALALPHFVPKLLAPAMNTKMYDHPATQANLKTLESYGYGIISPKESLLACGDFGSGALADLEVIIERIKETLNEQTL